MATPTEEVSVALEHAADAAEATAREQRQAATRARSMARGGATAVSRGSTREQLSSLIGLLNSGRARLATASSRLRRAWVRALADSGLSRRQIGAELGISHQRVNALLATDKASNAVFDEA